MLYKTLYMKSDALLLLLPALKRDIILEEAIPYTPSPRTNRLLDRTGRRTRPSHI